MQLNLSFIALLAGVIVALTVQDAEALPHPKRNLGMVTLPLKRAQRSGPDVHPQILLQQHINRSQRRLARMTGRAEPTQDELRANIEKRMTSVDLSLSKRYNRIGTTPKTQNKTAGSGAALAAASAAKSGKGKGKAQGAGSGNTSAGSKAAGAGAGAGVAAGAAGVAVSAGTANTTSSSLATTPDAVAVANAPSGKDSLGLDIEANDLGYLATVQMGTPPRDFLILMDSGSADLWVGAENCVSEAGGGCGNHKFLGTQSSSSFVDTGAPFQVTYGTGDVSGDIVTDNLVLAGLSLKAHTFGVATQESVEFSGDSTPFDGLMGLAQSTLSEQKTATPIEALATAGLVQDAIVSYKISRAADNKNDGEITFGGLDTTKFDPNSLVAVDNVSKLGFWEANMDAVAVDGTDAGLQGRTAILDTGTTLIVAPPADALAIHQQIQGAASDGQGGFTVPCTTTASVALTFGGTSFAIDPRDLAFQPVDPANPTGDCISGISSGQIGGAQEWLVGDVFLKNAYFSTDVTKNTVSLATLV